jgi:hypothetical protein
VGSDGGKLATQNPSTTSPRAITDFRLQITNPFPSSGPPPHLFDHFQSELPIRDPQSDCLNRPVAVDWPLLDLSALQTTKNHPNHQ